MLALYVMMGLLFMIAWLLAFVLLDHPRLTTCSRVLLVGYSFLLVILAIAISFVLLLVMLSIYTSYLARL